MASSRAQRSVFFPKADAAVLSCKLAPPPTYPKVVGPIYDRKNADRPVPPWSLDNEKVYYPSPKEAFAPATIPERHFCFSDRYLRASLTKNERFRLSMLWYHTRDIFKETEFLSGLQEKVLIAQETTGWEFAILGILDVNFYTRLATVGVPLGILPRGETLCAHTVSQPPGSVFLLPNMLEDWRFTKNPYVESGGLRAYAGAPLRLQNESGDTACLGSLCVASPTNQEPLTKAQQTTLARLADWVVSDITQLTRARRQRERRRLVDLIATIQKEAEAAVSEEPVMRTLQSTYSDAVVSLQSSKFGHIEVGGREPIPLSELSEGLWEDIDHIDDFITNSNHLPLPTDRVVRVIAAPCESVFGRSFLTVGTMDFRLVFDDIDAWFVQTCANIISQLWHKSLLAEVMLAKEKFLRGFSHQLRTPVHGILGSVELLAEELKSHDLSDTTSKTTTLIESAPSTKHEEEHRIYIETIKRAGRDLISIINSMITLNRWADVAAKERQYALHTTYDLETELVNETQKVVSGDARYNASLVFCHNLPPDHWTLRTDLSLMRDSLLPLIINAIQNTSGGIVVVDISVHPNVQKLVVDVRDTGHGIPLKDHKRIFELYEQVDVYSTGAGLGLTLSSKFAALLEGSVDLVSSEIDRGSHFRATFQHVELTHLESPLCSKLYPSILDLPKHFYVVPTDPKIMTLRDQFARFLTSYGLSASGAPEDALIVLDFSSDLEQHRMALSKFLPSQVIICLVPSSESDIHPENSNTNVIYLHGPFSTQSMSSALKRAAEAIPPFRSPDKTADIPDLVPQQNRSRNEAQALGEPGLPITPRASIDTSACQALQQPSVTSEATSTLEACLPYRPHSAGHIPITAARFGTGQLPTPPPDENLAQLNGHDNTRLTAESEHLSPTARTCVFSDPELITRPVALLVDDNPVNLRVMQMYCSKRNLSHMCAKDGFEAVSIFKSHQESAVDGKSQAPIQLILMDLQMPGCDGIEATRLIRQLEEDMNWGHSTLFVVTGQDSPADRKAAKDAGSQEFYVKPVSMKMLDLGVKQYFPLFEAAKAAA